MNTLNQPIILDYNIRRFESYIPSVILLNTRNDLDHLSCDGKGNLCDNIIQNVDTLNNSKDVINQINKKLKNETEIPLKDRFKNFKSVISTSKPLLSNKPLNRPLNCNLKKPLLPLKANKINSNILKNVNKINNILNDFDYISVANDCFINKSLFFSSLGKDISDLLCNKNLIKSINININGRNYKSFKDLLVKDTLYINSTDYYRDDDINLLPLDIINLYNDKIDIALYCIEIYNLNDKNSINFKDACKIELYNDIQLGRNINNDNSEFIKIKNKRKEDEDDGEGGDDGNNPIDDQGNDDGDEENIPDYTIVVLESCKDCFGNCYNIKKDIKVEDLKDFIKEQGVAIEYETVKCGDDFLKAFFPSNGSIQSHSLCKPIMTFESKLNENNSDKKIPFIPNESKDIHFKAYIKGFLIFNTVSISLSDKSIKESLPKDNYHTNMLWLNKPTLVKFDKVGNKYSIEINEILITDENDLNNLTVKLNHLDENKENDLLINSLEIPIRSEFYNKNFNSSKDLKGFKLEIQSISKYWKEIN